MDNANQNSMPKDQVMVILEEIRSQNKIFGEKLDGVSEKLDLALEDIDDLKSDNVDFRRDIKDMKVDQKKVEDHEQRIIKLEKNTAIA